MFNIKNSNLKHDCYQVQKQLLEVFYKKAALRNVAISKGKHLCWSLFLMTCRPEAWDFIKIDCNNGVFLWIQYCEKHLFWRTSAISCFYKHKCKLQINWLYVLIMSRRRFRENPHSIVAWMSRNSLLKTGTKFEV